MNHTPLEIIFEDPFLCIFNKPSKIHSVIVKNSTADSVAGMLLAKNPELANVANKPEDAGLVNRLDYETTGILIAAKTKAAWQELQRQQQEAEQEKEYLVIVEGEFRKQIRLETWIYSRYRSSKKVSLLDIDLKKPNRALAGTTDFYLQTYYAKSDLSIVQAKTKAARRHQIRAHAAYLGNPLCGDELYGARDSLQTFFTSEVPQFALHAASIKLQHPKTNELLSFRAPLPIYFEQLAL